MVLKILRDFKGQLTVATPGLGAGPRLLSSGSRVDAAEMRSGRCEEGELLSQGVPHPPGTLVPASPSSGLPVPSAPGLRAHSLAGLGDQSRRWAASSAAPERARIRAPGCPLLPPGGLSVPHSLPWTLASGRSPQFFQSRPSHAGAPSLPCHLQSPAPPPSPSTSGPQAALARVGPGDTCTLPMFTCESIQPTPTELSPGTAADVPAGPCVGCASSPSLAPPWWPPDPALGTGSCRSPACAGW